MPRIQHKRGTSANLASVNPTPLAGELVWDSTENAIKIGDGATAWTSLAYVTATPRSHVHDGGDITTGTVAYARLPVGSTSSTVCAGDDARLTDARSPTAHKASHATGGSDALTPAAIGAAPAASPAITGNATFEASSGVPLTVTNTGTGNSFVVNDASGDTTPFVISNAGRVGVNASVPFTSLDVAFESDSLPGSGFCGLRVQRPGSTTTAFGSGIAMTALDNKGGIIAADGAQNIRFFAYDGSAISEKMRLTSAAWLGIGRTSPASALDVNGVITVSATSGSAGSYAPSVTFSGDSNTGFGQVSGQSDTASIFTAGHERVRVRSDGNVGLGGSGSGNVGLFHQYTMSSASTRYGDLVQPTISAASTSNVVLFAAQSIMAASATSSNVTGYEALGASMGASAAITNQRGFVVGASFTQGTNNYAFSSSVPSGSNRWNIYADGTAQNYFAGNVGIGASRTTPASALDVNGVITVTGGSASAPALCISGDSNTGIFQASGAADSISITTNSTERLQVKSTGAIRFVPLTADPGTADAGDVYYNSSTNKLRVYDGTSWIDLH